MKFLLISLMVLFIGCGKEYPSNAQGKSESINISFIGNWELAEEGSYIEEVTSDDEKISVVFNSSVLSVTYISISESEEFSNLNIEYETKTVRNNDSITIEIRFFEKNGRIINYIDVTDEDLTSINLNIVAFFAIPKSL